MNEELKWELKGATTSLILLTQLIHKRYNSFESDRALVKAQQADALIRSEYFNPQEVVCLVNENNRLIAASVKAKAATMTWRENLLRRLSDYFQVYIPLRIMFLWKGLIKEGGGEKVKSDSEHG